MSISVNNVTKLYGEQKALDNVSFSVPSGEIVGFLGPNGAGKSTMMKIITCFIPPTQGDVKVCGYSVEGDAIEVKRRIGYLPEHNPLYLDMYVKEYLEFICGMYKLDKIAKRIDDTIAKTGLGVEQHKLIGALSKGYRQRVGLAQALIHEPEVLILDEPTTGLDPNQIVEIRNLIKEVGKEKTVMLSTHIMQEVKAICNRVMIINKGSIVADERVENIHKLGETRRIIRVEFDKAIDSENLKSTLKLLELQRLEGNVYQLIVNGTGDLRPEVFNYAVVNGLTVLSMVLEEQSMEDVFRKLTK